MSAVFSDAVPTQKEENILMQVTESYCYVIFATVFRSGRFDVMATTLVTSTNLIYVEPVQDWDRLTTYGGSTITVIFYVTRPFLGRCSE